MFEPVLRNKTHVDDIIYFPSDESGWLFAAIYGDPGIHRAHLQLSKIPVCNEEKVILTLTRLVPALQPGAQCPGQRDAGRAGGGDALWLRSLLVHLGTRGDCHSRPLLP